MHLVTTVLPAAVFPAVKDALFRAGITGMTVTPVPAHSTAPVVDPGRRTFEIRFRQMMRIEVVVAHAAASAAINAIRAGTAEGRSPVEIVVHPVERAIRIRTGETGKGAILPYNGSGPRRALRLE